jgi:hypothetical protein
MTVALPSPLCARWLARQAEDAFGEDGISFVLPAMESEVVNNASFARSAKSSDGTIATQRVSFTTRSPPCACVPAPDGWPATA